MNILLHYTWFWFVLMVLAIFNGALREKVLARFVNELKAHQLSTVIGMTIITLAVYLFSWVFVISSMPQAMGISVIWLAMTVGFEFGFGHWVMKKSWAVLLHDYNLRAGRVWMLFLIWLVLLPMLIVLIGVTR